MELKEDLLKLDGFVISQTVNNKITSAALFGIEKKDDTHLGHDNITWAINGEVICNDCNMCDSCQGSCHSSCQGSCTSSCQGCVGCFGGCTSDCQGCTTTCTNACYGCDSCTECQTCVGENCNSCDGSCTSYVGCLIEVTTKGTNGLTTCNGCYMTCAGQQGNDCNFGEDESKAPPVIVPVTVAEVSCSCFGRQGQDCGNNAGFGGTDTIVVKMTDGTEVKLEIAGENVTKSGSSERSALEMAMKSQQATGGKWKMTKDTIITNICEGTVNNEMYRYGDINPPSCSQNTSGGQGPQGTTMTNVDGHGTDVSVGDNGVWITMPNQPSICVSNASGSGP